MWDAIIKIYAIFRQLTDGGGDAIGRQYHGFACKQQSEKAHRKGVAVFTPQSPCCFRQREQVLRFQTHVLVKMGVAAAIGL